MITAGWVSVPIVSKNFEYIERELALELCLTSQLFKNFNFEIENGGGNITDIDEGRENHAMA